MLHVLHISYIYEVKDIPFFTLCNTCSEPAALSPKRKRRCILCGHCNRLVPSSTFYRHREQYFDVVAQKWQTSVNESYAATQCHSEEGM